MIGWFRWGGSGCGRCGGWRLRWWGRSIWFGGCGLFFLCCSCWIKRWFCCGCFLVGFGVWGLSWWVGCRGGGWRWGWVWVWVWVCWWRVGGWCRGCWLGGSGFWGGLWWGFENLMKGWCEVCCEGKLMLIDVWGEGWEMFGLLIKCCDGWV